jgi:hypothetical protein
MLVPLVPLVHNRNVLFMHNVGATQELMNLQSELHSRVANLMANDEKMDVLVEQIQQRMLQEADAQLLERNRIREAEASR